MRTWAEKQLSAGSDDSQAVKRVTEGAVNGIQ